MFYICGFNSCLSFGLADGPLTAMLAPFIRQTLDRSAADFGTFLSFRGAAGIVGVAMLSSRLVVDALMNAQRRERGSPLASLSDRELDVLRLMRMHIWQELRPRRGATMWNLLLPGAVAGILGYQLVESDRLLDDYLRTARHARGVVDRVFWG